MRHTFETQGSNQLLVITIEKAQEMDFLIMGMVTHNHIAGVIPFNFCQVNERRLIKYNITSLVTLKEMQRIPFSHEDLLLLLLNFVTAVINLENYMIQTETIILEEQFVFIDPQTMEISFICLPVKNPQEIQENIYGFFKKIIFNIQFKDCKNCDYVFQILNCLNGPDVSYVVLRKLLQNLLSEQNVKESVNISEKDDKIQLLPLIKSEKITEESEKRFGKQKLLQMFKKKQSLSYASETHSKKSVRIPSK